MTDHVIALLNAAEGYLELEMPEAAAEQIEKLDDQARLTLDVWVLRWKIYSALGHWELALEVAKHLVSQAPAEADYWLWAATSARNAENVRAAYMLLRLAVNYHPQAPLISYRLACYESQLGDFEAAKARLRAAVELFSDLKHLALEEPDLQPLWANAGLDDPWQEE